MRVENWESKLEKVIQETINKNTWRIGKNDCITFPIKCIEVITNIKVFEKKYKSLKDGKKLLKQLRSKDILDFNNRADLGGTLGVCIGKYVMFNWKDGINLLLKKQCKIAWRIE